MANQPRYRDAGIIMMIAAALGAILGIDIAVRAFGSTESKDTLVLSIVLIVAAVACAAPAILRD